MSREMKPGVPAVISVTHVSAGKPAYSVIPDQALLMGGVRTATPETRTYLKARLPEMCRQIAASMGAAADVEYVAGCPAVINDLEMAKSLEESLSSLFPGEVHWMQEANRGSEDGILYPHHNCRFRLDETVLWKGAAAGILYQTNQSRRAGSHSRKPARGC